MNWIKILFLLIAFFTFIFSFVKLSSYFLYPTTIEKYIEPNYKWWNSSYAFRIKIEINNSYVSRTDWPIEIELNFTKILSHINVTATLDEDSLRLIEYDSNGYPIGIVPFQFDKYENFNATNNAIGELVFILNGTNEANTKRIFFLYFDVLENGKKEPINFPTNLSYSFDGRYIYVNTSRFGYIIDTNFNGLTGIKDVYRLSDNLYVIAANELSEYTLLYNQSHQFSFLLNNSIEIIKKPIRLAIKFKGPEVVYPSLIPTNELNLTKIYYFYNYAGPNSLVNQSTNMIKIVQKYEGNAIRFSNFSIGILTKNLYAQVPTSFDVNPNDPYSYALAFRSSMTVQIINLEEINNYNYYANYSDVNDYIAIFLSESNINNSEEIASIMFGIQSEAHEIDDPQEIRNGYYYPIEINISQAQYRFVFADVFSEFNIYNLNETVNIFSNVTYDPYNLAENITATIIKPNSESFEIILYDDGLHKDLNPNDKFFSNNFTIYSTDPIGTWNITIKVFSKEGSLLFINSTLFNVTNILKVKTNILNKYGDVNRIINATITVKNYREDFYITNIDKIECYEDNNLISQFNILNFNNGTYLFSYQSSSQPGFHILNCSVEFSNNTGYDYDTFQSTDLKTYLELEIYPEYYIAKNITAYQNESFILSVLINNTYEGFAYNTSISLVLPSQIISNSTLEDCNTLYIYQSCTKYFLITIKNLTQPNTYFVNITVKWENRDGTINSTWKILRIDVTSNKILEVYPEEIYNTIAPNITKTISSIFLNSTGNDIITNISFNVIGFQDFNFTFYPNVTQINAGEIIEVKVNVTVPKYYPSGIYNGTINVTWENGYKEINVSLRVLTDRTWDAFPKNCTANMYPFYGVVCNVTIENYGNEIITFNVSPQYGNYSYVLDTYFEVLPGYKYNLTIYYNTTDAPIQYHNTTFKIDALEIDSNPDYILIYIVINPFVGPQINITLIPNVTEQTSNITINATILDRSGIGIYYVKAIIRKPDNLTEELNLVKIYEENRTSIWIGNFSNTSLRGEYNFTIEAKDKANITMYNFETAKVHYKLLSYVTTLSSVYRRGDTATIYFSITDALNKPISNATTEIKVKNPENISIYSNKFITQNGKIEPLPLFSISSDALIGKYFVYADSLYFDDLVNKSLKSYSSNIFEVVEKIEQGINAQLETSYVWFPEQILKFSITFYDNFGNLIDPTNATLIVYDPAENIYLKAYLNDFRKESKGFYTYKYAMPSNTASGAYLAVLNFSYNNLNSIVTKMFRIAQGGPFDLKVKLLQKEVERGSYLPFEVTIINMGETSIDVFLEYWVERDNKTYYYSSEWLFSRAGSNNTITRSAYIFENQEIGNYYLVVRLTYDKIIPPLTSKESFIVKEKVAIPPARVITPLAPILPPTVIAEKEVYKLLIENLPSVILIEAGGSRTIRLSLTNLGNVKLTNIELKIFGIPESWYSISPRRIETLLPNQSVLVSIIFTIPKYEVPNEYEISLVAKSFETYSEAKSKLKIFSTLKDVIKYELDLIEERIKKGEIAVEKAKLENKNVTLAEELLKQIKQDFVAAKTFFEADALEKAQEKIEKLKSDLERLEYLIETAPHLPKKIEIPIFTILIITLSAILLIIIVLLYRKALKEIEELKIKKTESKEEVKKIKKLISEEEIERIKTALEILEKEYKSGLISERMYLELKRKYEEMLKETT